MRLSRPIGAAIAAVSWSADQGDLRELGVSRKVVRKVIRSEATEFRYERETQLHLKIGPWSAELDRLLAANESKAVRKRLTPIRLFEELCRRL